MKLTLRSKEVDDDVVPMDASVSIKFLQVHFSILIELNYLFLFLGGQWYRQRHRGHYCTPCQGILPFYCLQLITYRIFQAHDAPERPTVKFMPYSEIPLMLKTSPEYQKAMSVISEGAHSLATAKAAADKFLDTSGKKVFTYSQPDSAFIVSGKYLFNFILHSFNSIFFCSAAAGAVNNPATQALIKEVQEFRRDPDTVAFSSSSKALHMRIGDIQATIGNISYQLGYLLKTQKFHTQELRQLMKQLHTNSESDAL